MEESGLPSWSPIREIDEIKDEITRKTENGMFKKALSDMSLKELLEARSALQKKARRPISVFKNGTTPKK